MYLSTYLHYVQLIDKSRFCNKNVVLCGRDMLYLHTQLCISRSNSRDSSSVNAATAAAFIVVIIVSHGNIYVLFQV